MHKTMSKEKVYTEARLLSKKEKCEVIVFINDDGNYAYSLLDLFTGSALSIVTTISDGYNLE